MKVCACIKSISSLFPLLFVIAAVTITQANASEECENCYVSDKGDFRYVLYNNVSVIVIPSIHNKLVSRKKALMADFRLSELPTMTVRVWGSQESYLEEQERTIGVRYPLSSGYVTTNEIRLWHAGNTVSLSNTALHEFVHLLTLEVNPMFANNPRWLWEAIAIYKSEEIWWYANNQYLIRDRFDYLVADLNADFNQSGAIYEVGYTVGEYIEKTFGNDAFYELVKTHGDSTTVSNAPIEELVMSWSKFVKITYFNVPKTQYQMIMEKRQKI